MVETKYANKFWILLAAFLTIALAAPTAFAQQNGDANFCPQQGKCDDEQMCGPMKYRGMIVNQHKKLRRVI